MSEPAKTPSDTPQHRYNAALAQQIEGEWQKLWEQQRTYDTPNPGEPGFDASRAKKYILDMFPYPSGVGLHVGHPLGYIATDIYARYLRMAGYNVLHAMGFDAFGLPAEQFALQTGTHPRVSTEQNIATMRKQLTRLGLGHDPHRSVSTTDTGFYKWTQWIFLQIYQSWYDEKAGRARPIADLVKALESGAEPTSTGRPWGQLGEAERRAEIDARRLAFLSEVPVNWCPMLGTVLANEEVTADGRSERGNFPVYKRPLRQWMMRITAYADRLLEDLEKVDWPEPIKLMQRNWIGRSEGAHVVFELEGGQPLRGGSSGYVRAFAERLRNSQPITAAGFEPRDPYPEGTWGGARSLIRSKRFLPHLSMPGATYFVTWKSAVADFTPEERDLVLSSLVHFDGVRCRVYAATVMSNHVHWVVRPYDGASLDDLVKSVKHFSATEINKSRGAKGHVWDSERFDHIVRDQAALREFVEYVVENPVEAGLVPEAAEYGWTYLHPDLLAPPGAAAERLATQGSITVFTTRPDTLFGATYMVLSPEHPLVDRIAPAQWLKPGGKTIVQKEWRGVFPGAPAGGYATPREAIAAYRAYARGKTDAQRTEAKEKTGVFTGAYAINPATGTPIPIFIADYVLMGYGTGAIMAVPAHDERDFEFAQALNLPIRDVVYPPEVMALRHFAQHAYTSSAAPSYWREQLADFMGLVITSDQKYPYEEALLIVRKRRGEPTDAARQSGRGKVQAQWLKTLEQIDVRSADELKSVFASAAYYRKLGRAFTEHGTAVNSSGAYFSITGLPTPEARAAITRALEERGAGRRAVTYKLRDWLFSRQRYWGEPFPIVYDEQGVAHALPDSMLPVLLPELEDFRPETSDDPNAPVRTPLNRARDWVTVTLDRGDGPKQYTRETNTMPNWAGSCWYYLRYLDPANPRAFVGKAVDQYWMGSSGCTGGVDLYVGGVEHAVLHLLYARFWHKVLFDLGHVSTPEPFQKLFNQGYIQAYYFEDPRGVRVDAFAVTLGDGSLAMENQDKPGPFFYNGEQVTRQYGKMGKSLKNAVSPDEMFEAFGCDTLRVYEMSMGPLEASKPWNTRDISGAYRFLQKVWRNLIDENTGVSRCVEAEADRATLRLLHKTIIGVRRDMESLGFNTVVSKLIELNNHLGSLPAVPVAVAAPLILMLAPLAPHIGEELWHRVMRLPRDPQAQRQSIVSERFPVADEKLAADDEVEIPVSVMGKLRSKVTVPAGSDAKAIEAAALADARVKELIEGKPIKKVIVVPGKMINFVLG